MHMKMQDFKRNNEVPIQQFCCLTRLLISFFQKYLIKSVPNTKLICCIDVPKMKTNLYRFLLNSSYHYDNK